MSDVGQSPSTTADASDASDAAEAAGSYAPGDRIAEKYELVRLLGEGGVGYVWVARDRVLDVHVALKIVESQGYASRSKLTQRTLQEARTAAQLGHSAICRVFNVGVTALGDPYVVSELLHGETLGDLLQAQTYLSATRAIQILLPIIDAISIAHTCGIVHRDVKPDNIFLARDKHGRMSPKLLDFGIARFVGEDTRLTADGSLLGTPAYMSPEQARGDRDADFRTDLFSMCVVLYEALTGDVPFHGHNHNAILYAITEQAPTPILKYGVGDGQLWSVLDRGLAKRPEARWQSIRELGQALARWLVDRGVREDVCGVSLDRGWLAGSGAEPTTPEADSLQPTASTKRPPDRTPPDGPDTLSLSGASEPETLQGNVASRFRRPRHTFPAAVGALVLLGTLGLALGFGLQDPSPRAASSAPADLAGVPAAASLSEAHAAIEASAAREARGRPPRDHLRPAASGSPPPGPSSTPAAPAEEQAAGRPANRRRRGVRRPRPRASGPRDFGF